MRVDIIRLSAKFKRSERMLYRKIFALILVLMLAVSSSAQEYTPGDVIVVLKPQTEGEITASSISAAASEFAGSLSASVKEFYPALSANGGAFMMIHSESEDAENLSAMLRENPKVAAVSPNYIIHAAIVPNDSAYSECWGMEEINAPSAWNVSTGSDNVYVAIIDSGVDHTNPDLAENVATQYSYNTIGTEQNNAMDDYGHGTHVAGTIGARGNNSIGVAGVNWNVKIIPVKALNERGNGTISTVINAMNYVTGLINQGVNIRAVNLSLETYLKLEPTHDNLVALPLWRAFKIMDDTNKAVIVVAAGNYKQTIGVPSTSAYGSVPGAGYYVYPASFRGLDNMISVSALDRIPIIGTTYTALFSNDGADVSAPGVDIVSTWLQSSSGNVRSDGVSLRSSQGTSMAAPHIAGAAALLSSINPNMTAYQLKQSIMRINGASGSSVKAASDSEFDLTASISYQESNKNVLPSVGKEGRSYDDYDDYETQEYTETITDRDNGSSSSGCSSLSFGIIGAFAVLMLARKRMS